MAVERFINNVFADAKHSKIEGMGFVRILPVENISCHLKYVRYFTL